MTAMGRQINMRGIELTYDILGRSRNRAAPEVLLSAIHQLDGAARRLAWQALLGRRESKAPEFLLQRWGQLASEDWPLLRQHRSWFADAVLRRLREDADGDDDAAVDAMLTTIDAASVLELSSAAVPLIQLAESSRSSAVRFAAGNALVAIVRPLGEAARNGRDQPSLRSPVMARLAESIQRFDHHRNKQVIDAFLLAACWGDAEVRRWLDGGGSAPLNRRLTESTDRGVIGFLVGFLRRRHLPESIAQVLRKRTDPLFRDRFLHCIGADPSATILRNLEEVGIPACCHDIDRDPGPLSSKCYAPLIHLFVTAGHDPLTTLQWITSTIDGQHDDCRAAAAIGLAKCEVPDSEVWMRAAVPVAEDDEQAIADDPNARLLKRLIDLLKYNDPGVVRGVRRVLAPLHAEGMMERFALLRPRSRRRIGRVVRMIDPRAVEVVRDELRHPVLEHRLHAIAAADALAAVDQLSDSFERIARRDHQEARIRAAEAMARASGDATFHLLRELIQLPECPVRDAAVAAATRRLRTTCNPPS